MIWLEVAYRESEVSRTSSDFFSSFPLSAVISEVMTWLVKKIKVDNEIMFKDDWTEFQTAVSSVQSLWREAKTVM